MSETKVRACGLIHLARQYNVSVHTIKVWLDPHISKIGKIDTSRIFTPAQVEIIYTILGEP